MRAASDTRGYTIVETLLFLAISGFMFVVAAAFVSGKQSKAEFKQGLNQFNSDISAVVNDVSNGYFPSTSGFSCTADYTQGHPVHIDTTSSNAQGTNIGDSTMSTGGCVFMGKIIDPQVGSGGYDVYTVAGRQYQTSPAQGQVPTSFADAGLDVVGPLKQHDDYHWGMQLTKLVSNGSPIGAIGLFTGFGRYVGSSYQGGDGPVVVAIPAFDPNAVGTDAQHNYEHEVVATPDITMCFDSGKGQWGTVILGGGGTGQRFATKAQIYDSQPSICT